MNTYYSKAFFYALRRCAAQNFRFAHLYISNRKISGALLSKEHSFPIKTKKREDQFSNDAFITLKAKKTQPTGP